jgi:hypothetical protein
MPIGLPANVPLATLQNFLRDKIIEPIMRKSALLAKLRARKRVEFNKAGLNSCTWPVRYQRRDIQEVNGSVTSIAMPYVQYEDQCSIPWSAYRLGDSLPKMVKLVNAAGENQIYDLVEKRFKRLTEDFTEAYRLRLWQDGSKTQAGLYGILSMFGSSSTPSVYGADGTPIYNQASTSYSQNNQGGSASPWWSCAPTQTYAGLSTALGNRDNNWNGLATEAWPNGMFSPTYNYFSPFITDYNSKYFSPNPNVYLTGTSNVHCWDTQWQQACNFTMANMINLQSTPPDCIMLPADLMSRAETSTINQQRFIVADTSESKVLGLKSLNYNGTEFITEFGVPSGCAFPLTFDKMNLWSLQGDLIANQKDTDIVTLEDLLAFDAYTGLWMESPAYFGMLVPVTAAGT